MKDILDRAISVAVRVHSGQKDKGDAPYIFHPIRVMMNTDFIRTKNQKVVALLHDVIEDSDYSLTQIKWDFSVEIANTLKILSKPKGEDYMQYIYRLVNSKDEDAISVKLSDLTDNLDITRVDLESMSDAGRIKFLAKREKYKEAFTLLSSALEDIRKG